MLRYDNRFDYNKGDKFLSHWEGPFKVLEKLSNGSYQLMDISDKQHQTRVNGWRLKPYFSKVFNEKVDLDKVNYRKRSIVSCNFCHGKSHMCHSDQQDSDKASLDNNEPLGLIAQDLFLAHMFPAFQA